MKLLCFGEILWDIFSDYRTLGGAPLNVSGHFSKLGGKTSIVSALGNDNLGKEALKKIKSFDIDTSFIQNVEFETGYSKVFLKDGIPGYRFNNPCAWDNISLSKKTFEVLNNQKWDALYFGTLAQRSEESRQTLDKIIKSNEFEYIFFDVNFRLNFYNKEILEKGLLSCNILKINDEELEEMCNMVGSNVCISSIMEKYNINKVILTEGKKGTTLFSNNKRLHEEAKDDVVVDTVGAGDSLSAAFLFGLLNKWPLKKILNKASLLADFVVSNKGAIPDYSPELLKKFY